MSQGKDDTVGGRRARGAIALRGDELLHGGCGFDDRA
jgi:hypothetical protein